MKRESLASPRGLQADRSQDLTSGALAGPADLHRELRSRGKRGEALSLGTIPYSTQASSKRGCTHTPTTTNVSSNITPHCLTGCTHVVCMYCVPMYVCTHDRPRDTPQQNAQRTRYPHHSPPKPGSDSRSCVFLSLHPSPKRYITIYRRTA